MNEKISWDKIVEECYDKELSFIYDVIKVIYTDKKTERAVILQRPDGLINVVLEKLYPFDDDDLIYLNDDDLHGYWSFSPNHNNSIFDTKERAIEAVFSELPFKKE